MTSLPPGVVNEAVSADLRDVLVLAQRGSRLAGGRAQQASVLPDVDGLRAERDPVEGRLVTVLTGHRHLAGETLTLQRGHDATGHPVVLRQDRLHVVVGRGEELLGLGLGLGRIPVVRVGLADDLDVTGRPQRP